MLNASVTTNNNAIATLVHTGFLKNCEIYVKLIKERHSLRIGNKRQLAFVRLKESQQSCVNEKYCIHTFLIPYYKCPILH